MLDITSQELKEINKGYSVEFYNQLTELISEFIVYYEDDLTLDAFIDFKNIMQDLKEKE